MLYEWLPSFGVVGKDVKEKKPHMPEILRHWHAGEYVDSPQISQWLGRALHSPGVSETCSWDSQSRRVCQGSPRLAGVVSKTPGLQVSPGASPTGCHTYLQWWGLPRNRAEEVGLFVSLSEPWFPYHSLKVFQCCLFLPLSLLYLKFDW